MEWAMVLAIWEMGCKSGTWAGVHRVQGVGMVRTTMSMALAEDTMVHLRLVDIVTNSTRINLLPSNFIIIFRMAVLDRRSLLELRTIKAMLKRSVLWKSNKSRTKHGLLQRMCERLRHQQWMLQQNQPRRTKVK